MTRWGEGERWEVPELADGHLTTELMARLLSGRVESEDLIQVVVPHLIARCPECRTVERELERLRREVGHWSYLVAANEGVEAPALWQRLAALPYAEQLWLVESDPSFQTWGLCRLLHHLSEQVASERPAAAAQRANLALRISEHLGDVYHPAWVCDLRALTHAHLGNARRCQGERAAAFDAVAAAQRLRAAGTGYAAVEAEALTLEALLRRDNHELDEAAALLDRAYEIYRGKGAPPVDPEAVEPHLASRVRAQQGWCRYHSGQPEVALALLTEAEGLLDSAREPRLLLAVLHGQAWAAALLGRLEEVGDRLRRAIELAGQHGNEADRLRLRRVEARLNYERGQRGPAQQALLATSRKLQELDLGVDAALTVMDLADLYLREDARAALKGLGDELFSSFPSALSGKDLPTEGVFALLQFQEACRSDRLTPGMVDGLAGILERHRRASIAWWSSRGTVLSAATYPLPALEE